jgi:hypothetical protein
LLATVGEHLLQVDEHVLLLVGQMWQCRSLMPDYPVYVTRDRNWFMVHIPALAGPISGLTQARSRSEVVPMARDYIATVLGIPLSTIGVRVVRPPTNPQR